jgi:hypothetical protein
MDSQRKNDVLLEENERLEKKSKLKDREVDKLKLGVSELEKKKQELEEEKIKLQNQKPVEIQKIVYIQTPAPDITIVKPEQKKLDESVGPQPPEQEVHQVIDHNPAKKNSTNLKDDSGPLSNNLTLKTKDTPVVVNDIVTVE